MKLQLDSAITRSSEISQAIPGATPAGKSPEALPGTGDGIRISIASTALNQLSADRSAKIGRVTASVQSGSYRISSTAVSYALVEDALSGRN